MERGTNKKSQKKPFTTFFIWKWKLNTIEMEDVEGKGYQGRKNGQKMGERGV